MKVSIIGCGRWGTFIAWYLNYVGHKVSLYGRKDSKKLQQLLSERKNDFLELPEQIELTDDLLKVVAAEAIFISINSQGLTELCDELNQFDISDKYIVLCMKGLDCSTGERLSTIVEKKLKSKIHLCVWLGPGHVQDYIQGHPNCMVIDSDEDVAKRFLVSQLSSELIRFYLGTDIIGNEIGGALKNVIGIAAGMLDGLNKSSLKGALMTRGTHEVSRLIEFLGGNGISAYGLCHLGDYEATLFSEYSHNRRYGEYYVLNKENVGFAEGVETVKAVHMLVEETKVEMPICEAVYSIIYENANPQETINQLFSRRLKYEF